MLCLMYILLGVKITGLLHKSSFLLHGFRNASHGVIHSGFTIFRNSFFVISWVLWSFSPTLSDVVTLSIVHNGLNLVSDCSYNDFDIVLDD